MTGLPIVTHFSTLRNRFPCFPRKSKWPPQADLHTLWTRRRLPKWVIDSAPAMRLLNLLGPLPWQYFPDRNLQRNWGQPTVPYAAFTAACLLQLNENLVHMSDLRDYLIEHPAFIWLFGFPLVPDRANSCGFDPEASLPTQRHLTRLLRTMPNATPQFLFAASVAALLKVLADAKCADVAQTVSLDTKHIIAWVKENNPKAYVTDRYDKTKQPAGDPDCKLGCKRRHNQRTSPDDVETPSHNPVPASTLGVGEYYWGYGSGVVAAKVPGWGEFVIAELTLPFNRADVAYFFPLMAQTDRHLGFRPRIGAFDAAFDAFYVYAHFHRDDDPGAFAAVPFVQKGGYKVTDRRFGPAPERLPLCTAGLLMPLRFTYTDRTVTLIEHERGKYTCPLQTKDAPKDVSCPVDHERWPKGGCTTTMPTSIGARLRYTLDRDSAAYKDAYRQRSATERINSQAVALGIERPHLRNGQAIANRNTLTYTLINLRFLQRIRDRLAATN
jgi:hypothetical protein